MEINKLQGLGVAMVTPFDAQGNLDLDALKRLTKFLIDGGVDYLVVQGTTGESPVLTKEEKQIHLVKYELVKNLLETILTESNEVDEEMGLKTNDLTIPFKIAFNSLLMKQIINKL